MVPETSRAPSQIDIPRMGRVQAATSRVNTGRLAAVAADAMEQPKIPLGTYEGERRAGMAWGAAAQQAGGLLAELAEKKARIVQAGAMAEAELEMRSSFAEFQNEIAKNPNQETWLPSWQKRAQALEKSIFGSGRLAPDAEAAMRLRFGQFAGNAEIELSHKATMQEIQRSELATQNLIEDLTSNGRFGEAVQVVKSAFPTLGKSPEEMNGALSKLVRAQVDSDAMAMVQSSPLTIIDLANEKDPTKRPKWMNEFSPAKLAEYKDKAITSLFSQKRDLVGLATQQIKAGEIANDSDLGGFLAKHNANGQFLDDGDVLHLESVLAGKAPVNADRDINYVHDALAKFPKNAPPIERDKFVAAMSDFIGRRFEGGMEARLSKRLKKIEDSTDDAEGERFKVALSMSADDYKAGVFGKVTADSTSEAEKISEYPIPETVVKLGGFGQLLTAMGVPGLVRPGTIEDVGNKKSEWFAPKQIPSAELEAKAQAKRRAVDEVMETWLSSQPADITPDQIRAKYNAITGAMKSGGDSSGILGKSAVGMVKQFEGFNPSAYPDFKQTSVGYGTRATSPDETLTEPQAAARLESELATHAKRVDAFAKQYKVELTPEQSDALISFDYNTGDVHRIFERAGSDKDKYPAIMKEWRKAGGAVQPGLVRRRAAEAKAFELNANLDRVEQSSR